MNNSIKNLQDLHKVYFYLYVRIYTTFTKDNYTCSNKILITFITKVHENNKKIVLVYIPAHFSGLKFLNNLKTKCL